MKLTIFDIAHHRNGVAGAPFDVVLFRDRGKGGSKVAIVFEGLAHCAVLDVAKLAAGDIAFRSNSWRGDDYEPYLREAIAKAGTLGDANLANLDPDDERKKPFQAEIAGDDVLDDFNTNQERTTP